MTLPDLSWWLGVKLRLVELTALERDAWHIYLAVAIQLLSAWVLRRRLSDWRTLIPLLVLEQANEFVDLTFEIWPPTQRMMQYTASVHDIINTAIMPVVILLIARRLEQRPAA